MEKLLKAALDANGKLLLIRFNESISVCPTWVSEIKGNDYLKSKEWGAKYHISSFHPEVFENCSEWVKSNGGCLYLHILD